MSLASLFGTWRAERSRDARARHYVASLMSDPPEAQLAALAAEADHDTDHAGWELRYAKRAIGLLVAERDALNDITGSDVAAALEAAHATDPRIAADRRAVAERQLNDRLRTYRGAMADRTRSVATSERLGRVLLAFAGVPSPDPETLAVGAEIAGAIVATANAVLRETYGEASLPEDIRPSEI